MLTRSMIFLILIPLTILSLSDVKAQGNQYGLQNSQLSHISSQIEEDNPQDLNTRHFTPQLAPKNSGLMSLFRMTSSQREAYIMEVIRNQELVQALGHPFHLTASTTLANHTHQSTPVYALHSAQTTNSLDESHITAVAHRSRDAQDESNEWYLDKKTKSSAPARVCLLR